MKYLDIDAPFIGQSTGQQWRLLVEEVSFKLLLHVNRYRR